MFRPFLVSLLCFAHLSVGALPSIQALKPGCGIATHSHSERLRIEKDFNTRREALKKDQKVKQVEVPVIFHVISDDESREGGNIPDEMIKQQIGVLNQGLSFSLFKTTRSVNPDWYQNVYPDTYESDEMLDYEEKPEVDGVAFGTINGSIYAVLNVETLPGGKLVPYNQGQTATHEVGHWVGLWHTFQTDDNTNKCDHGNGDFVADTPLQNGSSSGCPIGRDSCPDDLGLDPIRMSDLLVYGGVLALKWFNFADNFMDYSDDSCLTEFTPGQIARFKDQIATYRHPSTISISITL
ncbi:hypothetical protein BJ165DRAFT_1402146 [Panaeolus papilionaceus]|nr:hypothetical protein BJ165DRAFT_1402146 [Panaeolus papilionaceus]